MDTIILIAIILITLGALILGLIIGFIALKIKFERKLNQILKAEREDAILYF